MGPVGQSPQQSTSQGTTIHLSQAKRPSQLSQFRSPPSKAERETQQRQADCDPFNETMSSHIADSVELVPLDAEVNDAI